MEAKAYYSLNRIYEEIKDDIGYFVKLYTLAKVAGWVYSKLLDFLKLPIMIYHQWSHKYERLKREARLPRSRERNSARIFQELTDQIATMRKTLDSIRLDCEKEMDKTSRLQHKG